MSDHYDVVILGSGLASLCLARLLAREVPGATVLSVDTAPGIARKVGESTVEIGAHFLGVRLGLGELIARTQLPKNGLRFWFDDAEHSLSWEDASEDGPGAFAHWRTFQLERETLESALLDMNTKSGSEHLFGASGLEVEAGQGDAKHRVRFDHGGEQREATGRWLVDATGIRALHGRAVGNLVRDERITHSACWTWFEGAKRVDEFVGVTKPLRFSEGPRCVSTNLLLNEGYWIWLIPLASGLLSVGLCYDYTVLKDPPRDLEGFCAFLRSHRKLADLLEGAQPLEFGVLQKFSYRPKRNITSDRVAWLGMAAGFTDPFFAAGVDLIAIGCESIADLLRRDLAGEGLDTRRLDAYQRTMDLFYEHLLLSVSKLFKTFVSHELGRVRYRRDVHVYWDVYVWAYLSGKLLDLEFLPELHALAEESQRRTRFFSAMLRHTYDSLKARGALHRQNAGHHTYNQLGFRNTAYVRFEQHLGEAPDMLRSRRALQEIDVGCFLALLDALFDADRSPSRRLLFESVDAIFEGLLELWEEEGDVTERFWTEAFARLSISLHETVTSQGADMPFVEIGPETYGRLLSTLLAACEDPAEGLKVRRHFNSKPRLTEFTDMERRQEPPLPWSVDHTPWLDQVPTFRSVYDILGTTWWDNPKTPFSALANFACEERQD